MFDSVGAFTRQFTPVEGGYLFYPSKNSGGKLVTADEYEALVAGWEKTAGRKGTSKMASLVCLFIVFWTVVSSATRLPAWSGSVLVAVCVVGVIAWVLWVNFAPYRLVRDRPAVAPPRSKGEASRQARAALNWPFVGFALVFSGLAFVWALVSTDRGFSNSAWLYGSAAMFAVYVWIAARKYRDR